MRLKLGTQKKTSLKTPPAIRTKSTTIWTMLEELENTRSWTLAGTVRVDAAQLQTVTRCTLPWITPAAPRDLRSLLVRTRRQACITIWKKTPLPRPRVKKLQLRSPMTQQRASTTSWKKMPRHRHHSEQKDCTTSLKIRRQMNPALQPRQCTIFWKVIPNHKNQDGEENGATFVKRLQR